MTPRPHLPAPETADADRRRRAARGLVLLALGLAGLACSVGQGAGAATGEIHLPDCRLERPDYALSPSFFSAEFIEDPRALEPVDIHRMVILRMQRGSYRESDSDGISIFIRDAVEVHGSLLGVPLALGATDDAPALMTLYLGESCDTGFPRSRYWTVPATLQATSGTLVLEALHVPGLPPAEGEAEGEFRGTFTGVRFEDPTNPGERYAVLDGFFDFLYQRGRPAQRFPY